MYRFYNRKMVMKQTLLYIYKINLVVMNIKNKYDSSKTNIKIWQMFKIQAISRQNCNLIYEYFMWLNLFYFSNHTHNISEKHFFLSQNDNLYKILKIQKRCTRIMLRLRKDSIRNHFRELKIMTVYGQYTVKKWNQ